MTDHFGKLKLSLLFFGLFAAAALIIPLFMISSVRAQGAFAIVSGPGVENITEDMAVISWTTSEPATGRVHIGKTQSLEMTPQRKIIPMEDSEIEEINHVLVLGFGLLDSGTTYFYRAESVTADGRRAASEIRSFTTKAVACAKDDFACDEWSDCSPEGRQTRECVVSNDCPSVTDPLPPQVQTCTPPAVVDEPDPNAIEEEKPCTQDVWGCDPWGACSPKGERVRTCIMKFDCEDVAKPSKPAETEKCVPPPVKSVPAPEGEPEEEPEEEASPERPEPEAAPDEESAPDSGTSDEPSDELRTAVEDFEKNTENVSGDFGLIGPTGRVDGVKIAEAGAKACLAGGIPPEACARLLETGLGFEDCAANGYTTQESCDAFLTGGNDGVFPGCEDVAPEQCEAVKKLTMLEYLPVETKKEADRLLQAMITRDVVLAVDGITSISEEAAVGADWWKSVGEAGVETSAGVIVMDADGDTLPDDFERSYGTDPSVADTDGDGMRDDEELKAREDLDPTARTVVFRRPLEQPRGAGETDAGFAVAYGGSATATLPISGTCAPNATCLIFIYSYIPMVLTVTSDAEGRWTYDIAKNVANGSHTAYVAVTDDSGKITRKSSPFSFFIREAQAASEADFLRPEANIPEPTQTFQRWYLYGALALIVFAGLMAFGISRSKSG